jgi:hypothetical protein
MGPNGLGKGPSKFDLELFIFLHSLRFLFSFVIVWSGRLPENGSALKPLVGITDKTEHLRRRRTWTRGFTTAALKGYEPFVKNRALQLIDTLASKNLNETQNLTEWCAYFAYDVIIDLACVILISFASNSTS